MGYEIGHAYGYLDLMDAMKQFAAGWPQSSDPVFTGTGDAELRYIRALSDSIPLETWTIVCTTAGGDGVAQYSVTGSVSGAQASATAGQVYNNGIIRFLITGNPGYASVLSDQWVFTYSQGPMLTANQEWTILRDDPATDLDPQDDQELILRGKGSTGGTEEIYVGMKNYYNDTLDIYNWNLNGYTGYQSATNFFEQPGAIPKTDYNGLSTSGYNTPMCTYVREPTDIKYWVVVNPRRIILLSAFEAHMNCAYLGWLLPYYTPEQWNYPLFIGGNAGHNDDDVRYSNTNIYNSHFFNWRLGENFSAPYYAKSRSSGRLYDPGGEWIGFIHGATSVSSTSWYQAESYYQPAMIPYAKRCMEALIDNIDGSYAYWDIIAMGQSSTGDGPSQWYGIMDGMFAISGFGQSQENVFNDGGVDFVVGRNANFSDLQDYFCVELI